jgi:ribonucleoside-diphosphate reductase alpha chain
MTSYKREDVYKETLEYFNGDELATDVWINKYALKDSDGNIYEKTPNDMHERLSSELYRIEKKYPNPLDKEKILDLIKNFKFIIPQGGPMSGIGNNKQTTSLSNCFVIGNEADSYGGIFLTDQEQAQLMKRRGGVGHDLSHIRPTGSNVNNSALTSTGIVPFMERFSNTTREVAQDGRRGALMLSISINHPNSEDFIDAKLDTTKITGANISVKVDDNFMKSLENDDDYIQSFPVNSDIKFDSGIRKEDLKYDLTVKGSIAQYKKIKPKKLWDKIIHNSWSSAEPGILFWSNIINESVADSYSDEGFKTISTNPCLVGDTLISTADGRNSVSIKQLSEENKDVPVYTLDNNNNICIRTMRNPRLTGKNQKIYKITLDNGYSVRVTGNHKFKLKTGEYIETKNLKNGDSLFILTETDMSFNDLNIKSNSKTQDYKWLSISGKKGLKSQHRMIAEFYNQKISKGDVVHHIDYNGKNNNPDNLLIMTKKEHDILHSKNMLGDKNPYHKMTDDWKQKFASHPGKSNGRYINKENSEIIEYAKKLTKKLNRRFSFNEWIEYAKENNLPTTFSNYRKQLDSVISLSKKISLEMGLEYVNEDPRLVKTYKKALENGYDAIIHKNKVLVKKICEECGNEYEVNYLQREISFCSHECSLKYINKNDEISEKRKNTINNTYKNKSDLNKEKQIKILSDLKFKLGKIPLLKEWEECCKLNNIPYRLNTKHGYKNYKEIIEELEYYNHRVVLVEEDGYEDVYNGTVDEFHNFFTGKFKEKNKFGKDKFVSINNLQCGEIVLCANDSCRLTALNLYSYVDNAFKSNSKFNWELFKEHVRYGQRFMDDIIDLELEKIDKILEKIKKDPEDEFIKQIEINLWEKIKDKAINGRRTGLGITAEGDMLAAMGLTYGTKKATEFSTKVHKILAIEAYKSSSIMAKERGSFPIYNYEKENESNFIKRIRKSDPELDMMLKEFGRRNISLLTIAPAGCLVKDTIVKTDKGNISMENLFLLNNVNIKDYYGVKNVWIEMEKNINVFDINGNTHKINRLYWNGMSKTIKFKYSNGSKTESTLNHKFLVKLDENKAIWKRSDELKVGDKIIKLN